MRFIIDDPVRLAEWLREREGWRISPPFVVFGAENSKGEIYCVVMFNNHTGRDMEVTAAGRFTRAIWRVALEYAFETMSMDRLTFRVKVSNHHCIKMLYHLGARVEGRLRKYYSDDEDALVFGLLREECKYVQYF